MAPPPQDPLIGKVLADRFEILSRIGEGGTGVVYKARQIAVDRIIAIKILGAHVSQDPSWVKRFHNEARAAAKLEHPNVIRLIDFGETKDGLLFIAMEFLQGRPLAEEINRLGRLPVVRVLRILMQMCQALQEAHAQGIIHRDVKPDNVFLLDVKGAGDFVKVLDFSVAKLDAPDAQATRAGTVFGTPAYMSPEQGRGVKLTPQSDLYSCGIVAYEMLTGKPPFEDRLPMQVVVKHMREKPAPLVGFPDPVANLVMRALEKNPERRHRSAEEMAQECQNCLDQLMNRPQAQAQPAGDSEKRPAATGAAPQVAAVPDLGVPPPVAPGVPPPVSVGAPPVAPPSPPVVATPEQRTMMAQPSPLLQQPGQPSARPLTGPGPVAQAPLGGNRTVSINSADIGHATAFIDGTPPMSPAALLVQQQALTQNRQKARPVGRLFWVGWALLGMAAGLAMHFFWPVAT